MAAGEYNFTVEQGANHVFSITYKTNEGNIIPLTGYTVEGSIRNRVGDCNVIAEFDIDTSEANAGVITFGLNYDSFDDLVIKGKTYKDYYTAVYDIYITPPNEPNQRERLLNGTVKVSPVVTGKD
jgi:hypothetical protein